MSVDGKWNIFIDSPMGRQGVVLELRQDGAGFSGTQTDQGDSDPVRAVTFNDDELSWAVSVKKPMPLDLEFRGKVENGAIKGMVSAGPVGSFPFDGAKV